MRFEKDVLIEDEEYEIDEVESSYSVEKILVAVEELELVVFLLLGFGYRFLVDEKWVDEELVEGADVRDGELVIEVLLVEEDSVLVEAYA